MSEQILLTLPDPPKPERREVEASRVPITHHADPRTSAKAERDITTSGALDGQVREVYEAVKRWPGRTARELAAHIDSLDHPTVAKRLSVIAEPVDGAAPRKVVLLERGPVRACGVTGRVCVTWWQLGTAPKGGEAS